ncbi:hypothetical protein ACFOD0_04770 [Shewanella intestini]|uniref:Uncharacterized protein n=1 Tax=Shewanella intestini TaxID=2017544 RepID=A0ABS5I0R2_9GAMM|nr:MULTISPECIES: hypothetical protein [Shewanella]MBR9727614.1 hypothetical protein [Shewanella intestini]MRG35236.1 hypothetical protein [Shewanella sp. XMDDZSB0408]
MKHVDDWVYTLLIPADNDVMTFTIIHATTTYIATKTQPTSIHSPTVYPRLNKHTQRYGEY